MMKVLFVCIGNICRSPAGEGIFRALIEKEGLANEVIISSCGIGSWNIGHSPDSRIRQAASARGIHLNTKAKPFVNNYLDEFDYIMVSDSQVLEHLLQFAKNPEQKAKIHLMTAYAKTFKNEPVPDPFYAGTGAFDLVLDILEDACLGLLEEIKNKKSG